MSPVRLEQQDSLAWLYLQRPEAYNAFAQKMAGELLEYLFQLRQDESVKVVTITREGSVFLAGGDLKWVSSHPSTAFHEWVTRVHLCITEIRHFPKPILAVINGTAAGGGFSPTLACDFRLMAETARLKQAFTSQGLCLDGGGTWFLPRLVGLGCTLEITALDEWILAEQALNCRSGNRVVSPKQLITEILGWASRLADRSSHAFATVKQLLNESWNNPLETQLEQEHQGLVRTIKLSDGQEGLSAFLEKRPPRFA
jgi:2-(1,2-epoxy-1,2-dihydrophenyl)acetyl-CoA isomerase